MCSHSLLATERRSQCSTTAANLGDHYWLGKALVPGVDLDYHCKELPRVAEAGRQLTPAVTWHSDDACLAQAT